VFDPEFFVGVYEENHNGQQTLRQGRYQDLLVADVRLAFVPFDSMKTFSIKMTVF